MKTYYEKSYNPSETSELSVGVNLRSFSIGVNVNLDTYDLSPSKQAGIEVGPFFVSFEWGME